MQNTLHQTIDGIAWCISPILANAAAFARFAPVLSND